MQASDVQNKPLKSFHTHTHTLCVSFVYHFIWLPFHYPVSSVIVLSPTPYTHILSVINLPEKKRNIINKVKDDLTDSRFCQMFYRYCDKIVIVNSFGHDNHVVKSDFVTALVQMHLDFFSLWMVTEAAELG